MHRSVCLIVAALVGGSSLTWGQRQSAAGTEKARTKIAFIAGPGAHEYYFNQYFREKDARFVPVLTSMLPSDAPRRHVIAWAVDHAGGGRGFAFTGGHDHKNMLVDDYRRMLLNAIVWTAKMDVPAGGVRSTVPKYVM